MPSSERRSTGKKIALGLTAVAVVGSATLLAALGRDEDLGRVDDRGGEATPAAGAPAAPEPATANEHAPPLPVVAARVPDGTGLPSSAAAPAGGPHDAGVAPTPAGAAHPQHADAGAASARRTSSGRGAHPDGGAGGRGRREVAFAPRAEAAVPDGGAPGARGVPDGGVRIVSRSSGREGGRSSSGRDRRSDTEDFVWVARFVATGGASLEGRVVDVESGAPLAHVAVEARLARRLMTSTTDSSGAFRMDGMMPGTRVVVWVGGESDPFVAERTEVSIPGEGQVTDTGVIRLLRGEERTRNLNGWVGLTVSRHGGRVVVSAVSPWLPADRAQIEVGETLLTIDGRDLSGMGPRAVTFLLRGPIGSSTEVVALGTDKSRRAVTLQRVAR